MASPNWIQEKTRLSPATVNVCLRELERLGIVKEVTGWKRNRLYSYVEYIRIINEGSEDESTKSGPAKENKAI